MHTIKQVAPVNVGQRVPRVNVVKLAIKDSRGQLGCLETQVNKETMDEMVRQRIIENGPLISLACI